MIKVAAIVAFIIVGLSLILGIGSRTAIGLANLTRHGGFFPAGWKGVWLSLAITVTSSMGVEIIAVTPGEGPHPEVAIPPPLRETDCRPFLFSELSVGIVNTTAPWAPATLFST